MTLRHSRAVRLACEVTAKEPANLEEQLERSTVVVSAEPDMPMSLLTTRVILTTLRRGPGRLLLDAGDLSHTAIEMLEEAVYLINPHNPLVVGAPGEVEATIGLHVGTTPRNNCVRIIPEGFGAHVVSDHEAQIYPSRVAHPLGAIYAAALGAAEAFKYTAQVLPSKRVLHQHLSFCPVSLSADLAAAPDLRSPIVWDLALLGVGAVGTGIALILAEMGASGHLLAADKQTFGLENIGTYSLGNAEDARTGPEKVHIARRELPRFDVIPFAGEVESLPALVDDGSIPWPRLVLVALDTPEARRQAQRLWPDHLIDAGTASTMLGIHDQVFGVDRCLKCVYPPGSEPDGMTQLAARLGLPADRLAQGEDTLREEDLINCSADQRRQLQSHVGKPICGVIQAVGLTSLETEGYQPSAPFVSLQAACLAVGRLVAHDLGLRPTENTVQYDALWGPQNATMERIGPRAGCQCQAGRRIIAGVRATRRALNTGWEQSGS